MHANCELLSPQRELARKFELYYKQATASSFLSPCHTDRVCSEATVRSSECLHAVPIAIEKMRRRKIPRKQTIARGIGCCRRSSSAQLTIAARFLAMRSSFRITLLPRSGRPTPFLLLLYS